MIRGQGLGSSRRFEEENQKAEDTAMGVSSRRSCGPAVRTTSHSEGLEDCYSRFKGYMDQPEDEIATIEWREGYNVGRHPAADQWTKAPFGENCRFETVFVAVEGKA